MDGSKSCPAKFHGQNPPSEHLSGSCYVSGGLFSGGACQSPLAEASPFSKSLRVLCRVKNAWLWALIFSITVLTTRHYPTMVAFRGALTFKNGKWDGLILVCPWSWAASASARSTLDESHPFTVFWFLFFFRAFRLCSRMSLACFCAVATGMASFTGMSSSHVGAFQFESVSAS